MIHVVTTGSRELYQRQLLQMHRLRAEVFVRTRGWKLDIRDDGGEYDRGDDELATYLLALDEEGGLLTSIRLRPVKDWSILLDAMPERVRGDAERFRRADVWEMARFLSIGAGRSTEEARRRVPEIFIALLEVAQAAGVTEVIGACDTPLFTHGLGLGWRMAPVGLPFAYPEGGSALPYTVEVSADAIEEVRDLHGRRDVIAFTPAFSAPGVAA